MAKQKNYLLTKINRDFWKKVKHLAVTKGTTIKALILEGLDDILVKYRKD